MKLNNKWLAALFLATFLAACGENTAPSGGAGISDKASKKCRLPSP